ncbi:ABC-type Fe3+-hydroxamate transport system, periplasmic component [Clostridium pasteurianum DSM 525 = ATCC 6013]|uniref:ABC-type Fe3+-hydroxamate transport system, periplasmic component n=1 Tax=Clostridium pasteurianum DSM 525 = ATCC 6013 TaxID=1262449 RepID=A0A0H3J0G2_CLOPA|nr:ABC transporter substrate-binding protein [Clostridium pasteurianum]AJA47331.1 ABC-type Fe3+-hydroxamate transport system, periplasmic component [Clostridium pasteurianum DSM 525 = ATCC 6013]AJA51319.1 ABC-type Fe3+-hydroxamate transport system, periplasmic component [Clostridium pasteurianum DSM 525 = ATCC 6013]AOZ74666.1 ABC transporter substrate-binding protein [Clostridium pasteurianum DSM 525 = ATCC 6013]AOZ78463.1 ABC transporter substrate-binding protein [Clostridium pasteurianum]ELP
MRIKKVVLSLLLVVIVLVSISGCGTTSAKNEAVNATAATTAKTKIYTDMAGRKVTLSTNIKKIVTLRYMETNMLGAILGKDFDKKVISLGQDLKTNDIDLYNKFSQTFDMGKMVECGSVYDDSVSSEKLLDLDPDVIIVDYAFIQKSSVKKLIEVGLPVVFIDSDDSNPKNDSLYSMLDSMSMLGDMLGYKEKTDKMVKYSRNKIDNVLKITSKAIKENSKKPSVYFELGNVTPQEIGATRGDTSGGLGALLKRLGAVNIGEGHGMDALNPEVVLNSNPDMIMIGGANWNPTSNIMRFGYFITEEQSKKHLEEYTKRPGWSDLSAIKNGRLYGFHFNYAKYPFDFAMIEYIAKQLWPEQFKDVDPEADLKQFFSEYMPIKYSGVFFEDWKDK